MGAGLTEKQKRFCDEYIIDLNATRAYLAAYPATTKEATAAKSASRMLRNGKVAEYIRQRIEDRRRRTEITQDRVLLELAAIAFADVAGIISWQDGRIRITNTEDVPEESRKIIAGYKKGQFGPEVKLWDKLKALELLGRHLGMFDPKKDDGDREEQRARIEKLRAEAGKASGAGAESGGIRVEFVNTEGAEV